MPEAYDQEGNVTRDKRFAVALHLYKDWSAAIKMNPSEAWEEHQIEKATIKFGSKNKKLQQASDEYQFVFEDPIEFIKASIVEGDEFVDEPLDKSQAKSALEKLFFQSIHIVISYFKLSMIIKFLSLLVKLVLEKPRKYLNIEEKLDAHNRVELLLEYLKNLVSSLGMRLVIQYVLRIVHQIRLF